MDGPLIFNQYFSPLLILDFFLRIILSALAGFVIGTERARRLKAAGVRTHVIVCSAAALFMIVSKYGFTDMDTILGGMDINGTHGTDPARIAAQVVSGISFLCAGVIFKNGASVRGLTTAAGIWVTSAIGLAFGAGMYITGVFVTVFVSLIQFVMHHVRIGGDSFTSHNIRIKVKPGIDFTPTLTEQLEDWGAQVTSSSVIHHSNGITEYELVVWRHQEITFEEFDTFIHEHSEIVAGANQITNAS